MKKAFSLFELLMVILIIVLLAALLFPVFTKARDEAQTSVTLSRMRQKFVAIELYRNDQGVGSPGHPYLDMRMPNLISDLTAYGISEEMRMCRADYEAFASHRFALWLTSFTVFIMPVSYDPEDFKDWAEAARSQPDQTPIFHAACNNPRDHEFFAPEEPTRVHSVSTTGSLRTVRVRRSVIDFDLEFWLRQ